MHTNEKRGKKKTQIWTQHARKPRESNDGEDWGTQKKLKLWERKQQNEPVFICGLDVFHKNHAIIHIIFINTRDTYF